VQSLLNSVAPARLFLLNGRPPELLWRQEATAELHKRVLAEWRKDNKVLRSVSTLCYGETVSEILGIYWDNAIDHRIVIAPTGSKWQTVGVYFAKAMHVDVHIEYPTPDSFKSIPMSPRTVSEVSWRSKLFYSHGIGTMWIAEFGSLFDLTSALSAAENITIWQ
jgi:hypothetical protein